MAEIPFLDFWRVELTDDAGVRRKVPFITTPRAPHYAGNTTDPAAIKRIRRAAVPVFAAVTIAVLCIVIVLLLQALFFLWGMRAFQRAGISPLWCAPLMFVLALMITDQTTQRLVRHWYRTRFISAATAEWVCPMCLYNLRPAAPTATTAPHITCSECGARWRTDRFPRPGAT